MPFGKTSLHAEIIARILLMVDKLVRRISEPCTYVMAGYRTDHLPCVNERDAGVTVYPCTGEYFLGTYEWEKGVPFPLNRI